MEIALTLPSSQRKLRSHYSCVGQRLSCWNQQQNEISAFAGMTARTWIDFQPAQANNGRDVSSEYQLMRQLASAILLAALPSAANAGDTTQTPAVISSDAGTKL